VGHGEVEVVAEAFAFAAFILVAGDDGVEVGGVAVDGDVEDVVALPEDFLDALAVVHVGVEDGDFVVGLAQVVGSDGGVVQKAEAAGGVGAGVVARRATDGVGAGLAGGDVVGGGQGALGAGIGRVPGVGADGGAAVGDVVGRFREDALHGVVLADVDIGHDFRAPVLGPATMGGFEIAQIAHVVHGRDGAHAVVTRGIDIDAHVGKRGQERGDTGRHFLRGAHGTAGEIALGVVQVLGFVEIGFHCGHPFGFVGWAFSAR